MLTSRVEKKKVLFWKEFLKYRKLFRNTEVLFVKEQTNYIALFQDCVIDEFSEE